MAELGLKVKDLSDMVGLSPSYLSLILSGERQNLSDFHKDAIALALGTTVAALYTEDAFGAPPDEAALKGPDDARGPREPRGGARARRLTGAGGALGPAGAQEIPRSRVPPTRAVGTAGMRASRRDIGAFEDFLRALNVKDDVLLAAYYKELNALSDDEIVRFGEVTRRVLSSWQASLSERTSSTRPAPDDRSWDGAHLLSRDGRVFTALVAWLAPVLGDVPMEAFEIACGWPKAKVHRLAGALEAAGAVVASSAREGRVTVRLAAGADARLAKGWVQPSLKEEYLGRLARHLSSHLEPMYDGEGPGQPVDEAVTPFRDTGPEKIAELFLESRDYVSARLWYERAAAHSLSSHSWRVAKEYLEVVMLLDGIIGTDPEARAQDYQMMANVCLNLGDVDEALMYQEHNIAHWESAGRRADVTMGLLRAGSMLARLRDWGKAKEYLERALRISSGDLVLEARTRIGLASILSSSGSLKAAFDELERALDIGTRLNEPLIIVQSLLGLGRVYLSREDFRRASVALNQALSLAERQDPVARIWVGIELGRLFMQEGNAERARQELSTVADLAKNAVNPAEEHLARAYLSACLALTPDSVDLREAWVQAEAARRFFAGTGDSRGLVVALVACAQVLAALGDDAQAAGFFEQAAREGRESEDPALEAFACQAFGEHLERLGDELAPVMLQRARWVRAKLK
jgi:tetratricopeptide (TPR) repeat protein